METSRATVLCVDDEPNVLAGLTLNLGRRYQVLTAGSGAEGLDLLRQTPSTTVILSDMRMPGMDGATFLRLSLAVAPDAVRLLLTGHAEVSSAIEAVNEGQIFRFLTKPCPTARLVAAIDAAAEQARLVTAERVLLEQTLRGSIQALVDVLALTNPAAFGRANRLRRLVADLATRLGIRDRWQVEIAAMLSQLGSITLPTETVERLRLGEPLGREEQQMVQRSREVTERLLAHIPRLEVVRGILQTVAVPGSAAGLGVADQELVKRGAQLLEVVADYDDLEGRGMASWATLDALRGRSGRYAPDVLEALVALCGSPAHADEVREVKLLALRVGMVLAEDVKTMAGVLLAARGYEITTGFVERVRNYLGTVREPVRVIVRDAPP